MLKLRKILLHDSIYLIVFIFILMLTIIRVNIPKHSIYTKSSTTTTGIITYLYKDSDKITLHVKNKETLLVTFYYKNNPNLKLGDKIKIIGEFRRPSGSKNKYLFDYQRYLYNKNIFYQVRAKSIIKIRSTSNIYYILKNSIINRIHNRYLFTFILGDKSYLNKYVRRSYQENGISHLFAISGMHITLMAGLITKLLKIFNLSEEFIYKMTSLILLIYLFLVGLSPSILRGVLFYILFTANRVYYFHVDPMYLFLLVVSISLLINPFYIFDVGFAYSYLISLSLIKLSKCLTGNYLLSLLKTSLLSFVVSIPISLYNFYSINILSIVYNLFYVPLISIIIFPLSLLVFVIPGLTIIYNPLIYILEESSLYLSKISYFKLIFPRVALVVYIIYFILIVLYIFRDRREYLLILLFILVVHYITPYLNNNNYLRVLDIGQGDCILLHINKKNILIDTGGGEVYNNKSDGNKYFNIIEPTLKSKGIRKLDYLILSHGDKDHLGEAKTLINNYSVGRVVFNRGKYNYLERVLIRELNSKGIKYYKNISNISVGRSKLYFLNTLIYDNENDNSNVIYFEIDGIRVLLMGDASSRVEHNLLKYYSLDNITILKVGHHGSDTSSSRDFINSIRPNISLISVGVGNKYGHPKRRALDNLSRSKIYRTDRDGSIEINLSGRKFNIDTP